LLGNGHGRFGGRPSGKDQRHLAPRRSAEPTQTLAYEWAYARVFDSSAQRVDSLPDWLHGYNHHRPHTALGGKPPVSRVTNVPRFDT
jgi:transposase InsO family protein